MNGRGRRRSGPPTPTQHELMIDKQDFHEEEDDEKTCELEQSARIHPGSSTLPTADGRSEVGCKSLKCGAGQAKPALCCMMQAVADPQHLGRFIEQREKLFLLEGAWNGYSSAIAAAPCSKRTPTRFHRRAGTLSPLCSTGSRYSTTPSGKAGSCKDRNSAQPDASAAAVLSGRKCG